AWARADIERGRGRKIWTRLGDRRKTCAQRRIGRRQPYGEVGERVVLAVDMKPAVALLVSVALRQRRGSGSEIGGATAAQGTIDGCPQRRPQFHCSPICRRDGRADHHASGLRQRRRKKYISARRRRLLAQTGWWRVRGRWSWPVHGR